MVLLRVLTNLFDAQRNIVRWANRLRERYRNKTLSMERTRLLIDAGFDFNGNTMSECCLPHPYFSLNHAR
jgi:hypothetical protein